MQSQLDQEQYLYQALKTLKYDIQTANCNEFYCEVYVEMLSTWLAEPFCISTSIQGVITTAKNTSCIKVQTDLGSCDVSINESTRIYSWERKNGFYNPTVTNNGNKPEKLKNQRAYLHIVIYHQNHNEKPYILCTELFLHGKSDDEKIFMKPLFWLKSIRSLADWWATYAIDQEDKGYFTNIQEHGNVPGTDDKYDKWGYVISRDIYAFSNAFALTGEMKYMEAASSGIDFILNKGIVEKNGYIFFKGKMDRYGNSHTVFDDIVNIFTQFYALTGLIAYFDITRDPRVEEIIQRSLSTLDKLYHDSTYGGFYDAIEMKSLKPIKGKTDSKSFNSLVDPLSAVLFFLDNVHFKSNSLNVRKTIIELCEVIMDYCVNNSEDFIREVFRRNWLHIMPNWHNPYNTHFLAGNVGSNNKVIWSLLRAWDILPPTSQNKAMKAINSIHNKMQKTGAWDKLRGGWFDVLKRGKSNNGTAEHMWHSNKVWWQQESGILGYLIYYMKTGDDKLLRIAQNGMLFWCTNFIDYVNGGVFDTVSCDGNPVNRWKGSWVKGAYHETELARYLYIYLKVMRKEKLDLYYYNSAGLGEPISIPARIPGVNWNVIKREVKNSGVQKVTYEISNKLKK